MTIEELYHRLGGDFSAVCRRLPGYRFVERFLRRYLTDDSAEKLQEALKAGDPEESFRLALALKGVAANLGFEDLEKAVAALAASLRCGAVGADTLRLAEAVACQHEKVVNTIRLYISEKQG